ncbi:MAG: hypothetical protein K2X82_28135 [Gemmataceae bacterium]|nr:hypothetical protein [Gemmataceae bacterium]
MPTRPQDETAERLVGGTQAHGATPQVNVGGPSGGTNAVSPTGGSMPAATGHQQRGTANQAKQDAEAAFEDGTRKPSGTEAKQWARDDADVDTTAGTPYGGVAPDRQVHKMQEDKD